MTHIVVTGSAGKTTTISFIESILNWQGKFGTCLTIDQNYALTDKDNFFQKLKVDEVVNDYIIVELKIDLFSYPFLDDIDYLVITGDDHIDNIKLNELLTDDQCKNLICLYCTSKLKFNSLSQGSEERLIVIGFSKEYNLVINASEIGLYKSTFSIRYAGFEYEIDSKVIGDFNIVNLAAAFSLALNIGIGGTQLSKFIENILPTAGNMNVTKVKNNIIIIDSANCVTSLNAIFNFLSKVINNENNIISVYSVGNDQNDTKQVAAIDIVQRSSKFTFFTIHDYRANTLQAFLEKASIPKSRYDSEQTRVKAIFKATKVFPSDIILLLGRGKNDFVYSRNRVMHFSDFEAVQMLKESPLKKNKFYILNSIKFFIIDRLNRFENQIHAQ